MLGLCGSGPLGLNAEKLVVHEWGTFTALQDEQGHAIGGINTDDEAVPDFVHSVSRWLLIRPTEAPPSFFQGAPSCHPDVTMRLETPVIYFHPAKDFSSTVDVAVQFRGGWLTQYFPDALAKAPGITQNKFDALTENTIGSLTWNKIVVNASGEGPATDFHVWITPRRVKAAMVQVKDEREKYLFYRGVAHCDAPLRVTRASAELVISQTAGPDSATIANRIDRVWLADVRSDGAVAFRVLHRLPHIGIKTAAQFRPEDYSAGAVDGLKSELHDALMSAGLFADEADALLGTWSLSYFKSAGLRLFFLVPQSWTDSHLPLTISPDAETTRVMVGRLEIVTPEQRALLAKIAAGPAPDSWKGFRDQLEARTIRVGNNQDWNDVSGGRKSFASIGFNVPELYGDYLKLGRFRNALVLDEQKRRPTSELAQFIKNFLLAGYKY